MLRKKTGIKAQDKGDREVIGRDAGVSELGEERRRSRRRK